KMQDTNYSHPQYPDLFSQPTDHQHYKKIPRKNEEPIYRHKIFGKCGSTEMTKRMFEDIAINRNEIKDILKKRNKIIHEGILLPFGDINHSKQAMEDLRDVSDLLRQYLLILLNYKGAYYKSRDRFGCSVCLI